MQKTPTHIVQRTSVRRVTARPDRNVRILPEPDRLEHFVQVVFNVTAQLRHLRGDIFQREELVWVNRTAFDEVRVDVGQDAVPDFQPGTGQDECLEGQIVQMNVLHDGRAFDFNKVPVTHTDRIQDVGASVTAVELKCRFKQGPTLFQRLLGKSQHFIEISDSWGNFDSSWKELAGKCSDFMTLIENGLLLGSGSGNRCLAF